MKPWINYHHLYYFKTIVEEGTVSKAAEKLRLGQPTLSAQLKLFEDSLDVQLFERQHRRLILTEQGKLAFDYAKDIFRMGSEMYEVLHDRLKPAKPTLHVGSLDGIPKQIVLKLAQQALKISPCQITLSEGRSEDLLRELFGHRMDLMMSDFVPSGANAKGLYPRSIIKKPVAFFGAAKFKGLKKDFPESLSGIPMIVPTYDSRLRQDLDHWAKLHKIELNILAESQDIAVKKLMATHGLGVIAAATHAVSGQLTRNELFEIGNLHGVYEELYLIAAQRKIENPIASRLKDTFHI